MEKLGSSIRLPGFRPGKAPTEMLRSKISDEDLLEESVRELLPSALRSIMEEHKIQPVLPPRIEVTSRSPLAITVTLVEKPAVKLKGLKSMKIKKRDVVIKDEQVEGLLKNLRDQHKKTNPVERKSKKGDQLTVSFSGKDKEGKDVPGTKAEGFQVMLGESRLIPGFEEQLTGLGKGEEKSFTLTFPADYHAEHLRSVPVTFTASVQSIEEVSLPEFTDAFVKEHGYGESASELKKKAEDMLRREEENVLRREREGELFKTLHDATDMEIAPEMLQAEASGILQSIEAELKERNQTLPQWMEQTKKTAEALRKELDTEATRRIKIRHGMEKAMEELEITVSEDDMKQELNILMEGMEPDKRIELAGKLVPGSSEYEEIRWRKMVEKFVERMLSA